jgi:hypothetical protein
MSAKKTLIAGLAVTALALGAGGVALVVAPANADQPAAAPAAAPAPAAVAQPASVPQARSQAAAPPTAPRQGQARGSTIVAYDADAIAVLAPLTPTAITPGSLALAADSGAVVSSFPVVGNTNRGLINHVGGLTFTNGPRTVTLLNYVIDPAKNVLTATAFLDGQPLGSVPFLTLSSAPAQNGCTTTATLSLAPAAAFAFSDAFGVPDLTGAKIGTACVVLR